MYSGFNVIDANGPPVNAGRARVTNSSGDLVSVTTAMPRVLVSLVGIEKLIPRMTDLAVMLKLLARSSTGQPITVYNSIFGGLATVVVLIGNLYASAVFFLGGFQVDAIARS